MEGILKRSSSFKLSEKTKALLFDLVTYIFVLLFVYTAVSKFLTLETFQKVLAHYPLLSGYTVFTSYAVPTVELIVVLLLMIPKAQKFGMICTLFLVLLFLLYVAFMMYTVGDKLPCSCGGIISKLSWRNHIWFNSALILLAGFAIRIHK